MSTRSPDRPAQHGLNRSTIASLILSQLSTRSSAQLFLLDFERLVFRDFSRYAPPFPGPAESWEGTAISPRYLHIMREMLKADSPTSHSRIGELLDTLEQDPHAGAQLTVQDPEKATSLVRLFPQNCFAYVGGAFFQAYLAGARTVPGFDSLSDHVYRASLTSVRDAYGIESAEFSRWAYTLECGRFAEWITGSLRPRSARYLYVAPVLCDGSFFGILYRFSSDHDDSVDDLIDAIKEAAVRFREMAYSLIADVAVRLGLLEDTFEIFLDQLKTYQNLAFAVSWSPTGNPTVHLRHFPAVDAAADPRSTVRQLPWHKAEVPSRLFMDLDGRRATIKNVCDSVRDPWVDALAHADLAERRPAQIFSAHLLQLYSSFGLPIRYGLIIPGALADEQHRHHALELYYFEPPRTAATPGGAAHEDVALAVRTKLYSLVPLLQEVMILHRQVTSQAHELRSSMDLFLSHELRRTLEGHKGPIDFHILRCIEALALSSEHTIRSDWPKVKKDVQRYSRRLSLAWIVESWPEALQSVAISPSLLYFFCIELGRNGSKHGHGTVHLRLERGRHGALLVAEVHGDIRKLETGVAGTISHPLPSRAASGLALMRMLLRFAWRTRDVSFEPMRSEELDGGRVRTICEFPLALRESRV